MAIFIKEVVITMAMTYNRMLIDVNVPISDIVAIKQGDADSRYLDVSLYSNSVSIDLTGKSVKIYFLKPDSTAVYTEGVITNASAGRCQFLISGQTLAVAGTLQAEITIYDGTTEVLSTQTFNIYILPSIRDDDAPPSTNEFGVLVTLFQNIQNVMTTINNVLAGFDSLEVSTDAAKVSADAAKTAAETYGANISNKIGTSSDSSSTTVFGKTQLIRNDIASFRASEDAKSIIKSVQRGTFSISVASTTVSISSVNTSKCLVLINESNTNSGQTFSGCYLSAMTSTSLTISSYLERSYSGSWQVIEFN